MPKPCAHPDHYHVISETASTRTITEMCLDCGYVIKLLNENIAPIKSTIDEYDPKEAKYSDRFKAMALPYVMAMDSIENYDGHERSWLGGKPVGLWTK